MKADILTQLILPISLFIIMFGMGLALKLKDFARVLVEPKAAMVGIICQMLVLPLMGILIVFIFGLSGELAIGLMILSFCPGGTTSNMISYLSKGDVALSISLTAVVSLITPFSIPFFTAIAMQYMLEDSQSFSIPIVKTIIQLFLITIVPVAIGMIINNRFPNFSARADKPVKIFSIVLLFAIIGGIVSKNWDNMAGFFIQTGAAGLVLNVLNLIAGFYIAKFIGLQKKQAITIGIEVGIQNAGLALLVAGTLLQSAVMTIPAVTYGLLMFVTGGIFGWLVNRNKS